MNRLVLFVLLIIIITSCKKQKVTTRDLGYDYYPTAVGDFKIYEVDSLVFNDFTLVTDTYHFYYKDLTESEFIDAGQRKIKRMERYKSIDQKNWAILKVWTSMKDNFQVEENIDNIRLVKLVFPIDMGKAWDGNALNSLDEESFQFVTAKTDTTINGIKLPQTQKVNQVYKTDPLQLNTEIAFEHYAPNIGLVNKYEKFVKRFTTGVPGDPIIDSGYVLSMKIKSYQVE